MPVRVCVAIRESTTDGAIQAARRAAEWADIVEVRADFIRDLDLPRLLREKPCPILFTLRPRQEGGGYGGSELERLETLMQAAGLGADWIDVEFSAFWKGVLTAVGRQKVVLSHHDFSGTPPSLEPMLDEMAVAGAGILKIATTANRLSDNLVIKRGLARAAERGLELCALAMGPRGVPSRLFAPLWGSWTTFASLPEGEATADGQLPADELKDLYRIRRISPSTRVFGVLGRPLAHSLSPRVHNAAFAATGRDAVYVPLEAADIEDFLHFSEAFAMEGVSVTIPYKEAMHHRAASLSVEADRTGAVNTLLRRNGGWHGENTDIEGFLRPLRRRAHPGSLRAVVLGAGGAARAAVYGLASQGASVCVVARDPSKAQQLARQFGTEQAGWHQLKTRSWDLLVNATPVGTYPNVEESPVPAEWLTGEWVYDLVYNPKETKLIREAARRGRRVICGSEMFLAQAVKQQQLWFREQPQEGAMQSALDDALSGGR